MRPVLSGTARLVLDPLLAVLFPARCPACDSFLAQPTHGPLCGACWQNLPRHLGPLCACGTPLGRSGACARCRRGLQPVSAGCSLGPFEGSLRLLVHELKYRGRRRVAERLAEALSARAEVRAVLSPGVLLVPVPLHPRRHSERGFNQSELLAQALARRLNLECAPACLVRRKDTAAQTGLSAAQRRKNLAGAFVVRRRAPLLGRVVVLVDDVVTTGATVSACARALREASVAELRLCSAARVL